MCVQQPSRAASEVCTASGCAVKASDLEEFQGFGLAQTSQGFDRIAAACVLWQFRAASLSVEAAWHSVEATVAFCRPFRQHARGPLQLYQRQQRHSWKTRCRTLMSSPPA